MKEEECRSMRVYFSESNLFVWFDKDMSIRLRGR